MSPKRSDTSGFFLFFLSSAILCTALLTSVRGQESSDLFLEALPADTFMYVEVENIQNHVDRVNGQIIKNMSDQQAKTYRERKDRLMNKLSSKIEETAGVNPMDILPHVKRVRMAVPSSKFQLGGQGKNDLPLEEATALVAVELDRADVVSQMLTGDVAEQLKVERKVNGYTLYRVEVPDKPKDAPTPYLLHRDKQVYITEDPDRLAGIAEGPGSDRFPDQSLAGSSVFQSTRKEGSSTETLANAFVNITSFWDHLGASLDKQQKMYYEQAAKILGFEEMERLSLNVKLGDGLSSTSMMVEMSGNEFPLYDLLIQADPSELKMTDHIPDNAFNGLVSRIPDYAARLPKIKQKFIESMTQFGQKEKEAEQQWKMGMLMASKQIGVGVEKLLDQLGEELAVYMTPSKSSNGDDASTTSNLDQLVVQLGADDGRSFQKMFEEQIRTSQGYKNLKNMESTGTYNGTTLYSYDTPNEMEPTVFFLEDQVVFAGSEASAKRVIDGGSSVTGASWFQKMRAEIPEKTTHMTFTEYSGYLKYARSLGESMENPGGVWSDLPFDRDLLENLYLADGKKTGAVTATTTAKDRVTMQGVAPVDFSMIDPEKVNGALKRMIEDLEEDDTGDDDQEDEEQETKSF